MLSIKSQPAVRLLGGLLLFTLASAGLEAAEAEKDPQKEQFAKRIARLWSLQPVTPAALPGNAANPIDAFVAAKYQEKGLHPAPQADRLTLLRRLYFDLIGLPPTVGEQDAFLQDHSPDAYQKVVDRLLADP